MTPLDLVLTPKGLRFLGQTFPCAIGKGGIRHNKQEGDGATPVGTHDLVGCLYRPDRLHKPCDWAAPIRPGDLWSDDSTHQDYNQLVRAPYPFSHEALRRADPLYDLILVTDWNWPNAQAQRGSAIFIHQWRKPGHPTEGCVALRRAHLHWIVPKLQSTSRLIVPQKPATAPLWS